MLGRLVRKWHRPTWTAEANDATRTVGVYDLMELRCAIDVDAVAAGLSATSWTNQEIVAGKDEQATG